MCPFATQAPWKVAVNPLNVTNAFSRLKGPVSPFAQAYVPLTNRCSPYWSPAVPVKVQLAADRACVAPCDCVRITNVEAPSSMVIATGSWFAPPGLSSDAAMCPT
jgi:hypothetical protein